MDWRRTRKEVLCANTDLYGRNMSDEEKRYNKNRSE